MGGGRAGGIFKRRHCALCKSGQSRCPRSGSDSDALSLLFRLSQGVDEGATNGEVIYGSVDDTARWGIASGIGDESGHDLYTGNTWVRLVLRPACCTVNTKNGSRGGRVAVHPVRPRRILNALAACPLSAHQ